MTVESVSLFLLLVLAAVNCYASYVVAKSAWAAASEKIAHIAIVWIFPFLGGWLVLGVHKEDSLVRRKEQASVSNDEILHGIDTNY